MDEHPLFVRVAPVPFATVCFRLADAGEGPTADNERTFELLEREAIELWDLLVRKAGEAE